jgi:hypothetical protein
MKYITQNINKVRNIIKNYKNHKQYEVKYYNLYNGYFYYTYLIPLYSTHYEKKCSKFIYFDETVEIKRLIDGYNKQLTFLKQQHIFYFFFYSDLANEIIANRFHPKNMDKWVDWGFDDGFEFDE